MYVRLSAGSDVYESQVALAGVGVVVFVGQEDFGLRTCVVVVLVSLDLWVADGAMALGVAVLLVCTPHVTIAPGRPWPSVEIDGLVVNGACRSDSGLVVNRCVNWKGCKSGKEGTSNFGSS